jgi:hypothetical protein
MMCKPIESPNNKQALEVITVVVVFAVLSNHDTTMSRTCCRFLEIC